MSGDGILPDGDSESIHVVGYLPTRFDPSIPDAVLIEKNGIVKMSKDWSEQACTNQERTSAIETNLKMTRGEWLVIDDGAKILPLSDLGPWRDRMASELVQKAGEIKGDPLRVLKMLESAAHLRSLDLEMLLKMLKIQRTDGDENLEKVFLRVRDSLAEDRTRK